MPPPTSVRILAAVFCAPALVAAALPGAQREPQTAFSMVDADQFERKLLTIVQNGTLPSVPASRSRASQRTAVTEAELNAYLRLKAQAQIPAGVVDPYVWAQSSGRLSGAATVDLDVVRDSQTRGWLDPIRYLRGRLLVRATGVLSTSEGVGRFELESATVGGLPAPRSVLRELVSYYSRTAANPAGIDMDAPFALPAAIRQIDVRPGRAVIIQ
jgi:hypothetical protein